MNMHKRDHSVWLGAPHFAYRLTEIPQALSRQAHLPYASRLPLLIEEVEEHSTDGGEGCAAGAKEREDSPCSLLKEGG